MGSPMRHANKLQPPPKGRQQVTLFGISRKVLAHAEGDFWITLDGEKIKRKASDKFVSYSKMNGVENIKFSGTKSAG